MWKWVNLSPYKRTCPVLFLSHYCGSLIYSGLSRVTATKRRNQRHGFLSLIYDTIYVTDFIHFSRDPCVYPTLVQKSSIHVYVHHQSLPIFYSFPIGPSSLTVGKIPGLYREFPFLLDSHCVLHTIRLPSPLIRPLRWPWFLKLSSGTVLRPEIDHPKECSLP